MERIDMADKPNYKKPPVIEVAIGVQFAQLKGFTAAHVGHYWDTVRDHFGRVKEQPPIMHVVEPDELDEMRPPALAFSTQPDLPRTWFIDDGGNYLIQLQRDKFLYNWRKQAPDDVYPRFPAIRDGFVRHWNNFLEFLEKEGLPAPSLDQFELTYANDIEQGSGWDTVPDLSSIFTTFEWKTRAGFLPAPERVGWNMSFRLPNRSGRMHVETVPVRRPPKNTLAIRLSLTIRGRPEGRLAEHAVMMDWFEVAREWIVVGFADLVGEKTDGLWGREP